MVLIDLTPEALIARLRAGKVYPGQNIDAALNNFFRIENLAALREVALRQVAEEVESKRLVVEQDVVGTRQERVEADAPKAVGERILALVRPRRSSQRLVRRAWRSAQRLGTDLDLLWVKRPQERMSERKEKQLAALRRLASVLGAELLIEERDDVVEATAEVARRRGTTYIFVGESPPRRGLARLREPLPQRLMHATASRRRRANHRRPGRSGPRGRAGGGSGREPDRGVLIAVGLAVAGGGGFLIARRRVGRPALHEVPPDPAAVHRAGDLAPRAGRRASHREGRERHPDARLPGDRPHAPRARYSPAQGGVQEHAAARGDRAAGRRQGVPVDARIEVGRSYRHALLRLLENETVDRVVVSATAIPGVGFSGDDLVWLLQEAPAEVLILRPAPEDTRVISASNGNRPNGAVRNGATRPPGVRRQP